MAFGLAILGNQMLRSYAVWDNGWRPLKPETHLENVGGSFMPYVEKCLTVLANIITFNIKIDP